MATEKTIMERARAALAKMAEARVLVVGDAIIDKYVFVQTKGRAVKDPILSTEYISHEVYAGGVLAVANHIATFVKSLTVVTVLGDKETQEGFIRRSLLGNAKLKVFYKEDAHTTVKERVVDPYRNNKLFKIEYMNDAPITQSLNDDIVRYLKEQAKEYDLVIVTDFGHGFINQPIRDVLQAEAKFLCLNVQSNSANMGYNYVTHYTRADFLSLDERELRLPLMRRFEPIETVIEEFAERFGFKRFLVTLGKVGCAYCTQGKIYKAEALAKTVKDTIGAGDAVYAIASLFTWAGAESDLIPFVGNAAGAIKVTYMGNKESVTRERLEAFLAEALK